MRSIGNQESTDRKYVDMKTLREAICEAHPDIDIVRRKSALKADISRQLRHARRSAGLTQVRLSALSGLAPARHFLHGIAARLRAGSRHDRSLYAACGRKAVPSFPEEVEETEVHTHGANLSDVDLDEREALEQTLANLRRRLKTTSDKISILATDAGQPATKRTASGDGTTFRPEPKSGVTIVGSEGQHGKTKAV